MEHGASVELEGRGWSGELRMQRPYVSHHLQARQLLLSYLHGKEMTERNLEA